MSVLHNTLRVPGLAKPVRLFHITDSHLTGANEADSPYVHELTVPRTECFSLGKEKPTGQRLQAMLAEAEKAGSDCVLLTGDIIDYPSDRNLADLRRVVEGLPSCFYITGNHDWTFPADGVPTEALREERRRLLEDATGFDMDFCTKEVGGVLLLGIDNGSYQVTQKQYDLTRQALERGLPTILCCHIPLYVPSLMEDTIRYWRAPILMGVPAAQLEGYSFGSNRLEPTPLTAAYTEMIRGTENVAAVIAGHIHFAHEDELAPGKPQYITACTPEETEAGRILDLIP